MLPNAYNSNVIGRDRNLYAGGVEGMKNYIESNSVGIFSKVIVGGMFVLTAVMAVLFDDVTPATMLFI